MSFYFGKALDLNDSRESQMFERPSPSNADHRQRIEKLGEKIQFINKNKANHMREEIQDDLAKRILEIQKSFFQESKLVESQIKQFKESLLSITHKSTEVIKRCDLSNKTRLNMLSELKRKVLSLMNYENMERKQMEVKLYNVFEEKHNLLLKELEFIVSNRIKYFSLLEEKLQNTLPLIDGDCLKEIQETQGNISDLSAHISIQFQKLKSNIQAQQKIRQQEIGKVIKMIKEVTDEIKFDIEEERRTRQANKQKIISLFQSACKRLQI